MLLMTISIFVVFFTLIFLRIPIAFSIIATTSVFFLIEDRLDIWSVVQRIYGGIDSFILLAVPFFILAGNIMNEAKVTDKLIEFASALIGWVTGGLAMINITVSLMFAGISGSSTADTAGIGSVLIPEMKRKGYATDFTVAVTAASSVLGTIIPPSILLVVWGSLTGTSIGALFIGGIVPGILVALSMFILAFYLSKKNNYPREKKYPFNRVIKVFFSASLSLFLPIFVIGAILTGIATPTEAAVIAVLYSFFLGFVVYRTLSFKNLPRIFLNSGRLATIVLFAVATASSLSYLLAFLQVPKVLEGVISDVPVVLLLPIIMICWLIVGTFLDALPAITIMIPIFAPVVEAASIDPLHYGIASAIALSFGLITPPYGLCLLIASKIGEIPLIGVMRMTLKFLGVMLIVLVLIVFIPDLVLWLPGLLGY